jgi:hypothetical protein
MTQLTKNLEIAEVYFSSVQASKRELRKLGGLSLGGVRVVVRVMVGVMVGVMLW